MDDLNFTGHAPNTKNLKMHIYKYCKLSLIRKRFIFVIFAKMIVLWIYNTAEMSVTCILHITRKMYGSLASEYKTPRISTY